MNNMHFTDAKQYEFLWKNNGNVVATETVQSTSADGQTTEKLVDKAERIEMTDALSAPDAPAFFPIVVENYVREAIEPLLIGTSLLTRINYKVGQFITLPSVGAMYADDIDEGMEYPEKDLNFGAGVKISNIGKSGIAVKFTEEMKRYSQYDVVGMHLRAAGKALARHKEQKIFNMLSRIGTVTHDNLTPSGAVFGSTTGRSIDGSANGSITVDNIIEAHGQVMQNGYVPDTLLVHPMTFTMFLTDPILRTFAVYAGGGQWYNGPNGILNKDPWDKGALGALGPRGGTAGTHPGALAGNYTPNNQYNQNINSGLKLPNYLGLGLNVIVSPFVPYNPQSRLTNLYMCDSSVMGAIIVDEEPVMDEVPDKLRDLVKIKIRERYVVAPLDEGRGVAVIKNVKVTPNEVMAPTMATLSVSDGASWTIDRTASPL